eukprot:comp21246_c0_seq1/m.28940 comp21246_c0_seq1/g.28940  ORF comp21246_c0_seq1/g.28940 comp21246_c0_seq1/m.28940 type:complete len:209 (-) comp21246_c0_seq1:84-710(-)
MRIQASVLSVWALVSCMLAGYVSGMATYYITVPAGEEMCFYETLQAGIKMTLSFAVSEGGNHDIDVKITGPDGKVVGLERQEHDLEMDVDAYMDGKYTYCFSNEMSSVTDKELMFYVEHGAAPKKPDSETEEKQEKLASMVNQLSAELSSVEAERQYMELRQANHKELAESTNTKVVYWAALECSMIVAMSAFQIYYLKRTFETKTVV